MGEIWFYDASALTYIKPSAFTVDAAGRLTGSVVRADGATAVAVATGDLIVKIEENDVSELSRRNREVSDVAGTAVKSVLISKA